MRPLDFRTMALPALAAADEVSTAEPWQAPGRPGGIALVFGSGSGLWLAVTSAPPAASAAPLAAGAAGLPDLYRAGAIRPYDAVVYLAAVLDAAALPGVDSVTAYPQDQHPGLGAVMKDGARVLMPAVHTARSGQGPGRPYQLQQTF
jgi:hypothetical protein